MRNHTSPTRISKMEILKEETIIPCEEEEHITLPSTLLHYLKTGELSDLEFLVGPERCSIKAHKTILQMRSPVFLVMCGSRWLEKLEIGMKSSIELLQDDPPTFLSFLTFLYTDELDTCNGETKKLLDLCRLGGMYQIPSLVQKVSDLLEQSLSLDNCVHIFEGTKVLRKCVSEVALRFIKTNISRLLESDAFLDTGLDGAWQEETWKDILSSNGMDVEEIELFRGVIKWSISTRKKVEELLPLIRLPLLSSQEFIEWVLPTNILSEEVIIKILLYFLNPSSFSKESFLPHLFESRIVKRPTTSHELSYFLKRAAGGDVIELLDREYEGEFLLTADHVVIQGQGTLRTRSRDKHILTIQGSRCLVSGLRFFDLEQTFARTNPLVIVSGSRNKLENISVNVGTYFTELSQSDGAIPSRRIMQQNPCFAVELCGQNNKINSLNCINRGNAVKIWGERNQISDLIHTPDLNGGTRLVFGTAVEVVGGISHQIQNVRGDWFIKFAQCSVGCQINGCEIMGVTIDGWRHEFKEINAKKWIKFVTRGDKNGHVFTDTLVRGTPFVN